MNNMYDMGKMNEWFDKAKNDFNKYRLNKLVEKYNLPKEVMNLKPGILARPDAAVPGPARGHGDPRRHGRGLV